MNENLIVGLASLVVIVGGVVAMVIKEKINDRRAWKEAIANYIAMQRNKRIAAWRWRAKVWKIERKKAIKVQFD